MDVKFTNNLPRIARSLESAASRIVKETLFQIERDWKADVRVDTGTYRNSIQTDGNRVGSNVEHALPNEYGTRYMAARPSATQAAERNGAEMRKKLEKLEGSLK